MANAWLALPLILVAGLVPGWLIVRQFNGPARPTLVLGFAALTLGLALTGWLALVLAELGGYSLGRLALAWLASVGSLAALEWGRRRAGRFPAGPVGTAPPAPCLFPSLPVWLEAVFLAAWLVAALWLFFRPHETVTGAADAGVYVNLGASIDRQGSILIQDELLAVLDPALYPGLLRPQPDNPVAPYYLLPGFYVIGQPPGQITPQFYPLHPVWQAVAYGLGATPERLATTDLTGGVLAGVQAELLLTGLWALLGSLAIYLLVRSFAGWETAALALLGLSLTAIQVWFARYPTTEMLTQYLLWAGLLGLALWLGGDGPARLWALLAGVGLGQVFLVRVDMLVLLPVIGLMVVVLWLGGRRLVDRAALAWFTVPFGALVAHSFVHAWWQSRPYFVVHSGLGLRLLQVNWAIPVVALLVGAVGLWLLWRYGPSLAERDFSLSRRYALVALIGVALAFALYGWFVRPVVGQTILRPDAYSGETLPLTDYQNWPRLGWYLSPLGIWLGVAGLCVLIWQMNRRVALMLAVGGLFAALYLWNLRANPHQIYAMRRYVPVVVPLFIIGGATFIGWLARGRPRGWQAAAGLLAVAWLGGLGWSARGFISQVDYAGLTIQLQTLSERFEPGSVLLFNDPAPIGQGDFFGTPLKFLFGHDVFTVRDLTAVSDQDLVEAIEFWQNSGRAVYWIGDATWPQQQGFRVAPELQTLTSRHLEQSYLTKPQAVLDDEWVLSYTRLEP